MRILDKEIENREIVLERLISYGFIKKDNQYIYEKLLFNDNFKIIVEFSNNKLTSKVIDINTNEDFVLVDVTSSKGEFVGSVKNEYDNKLQDIIDKCTINNVFKSEYAKKVINYVKEKYDDDLEFLWEKFPKNAVFRHQENKKWYGALLVLSKRKLGINDDTVVDIIDLKNTKEKIEKLIDNKKYFPGYHMNKNHWFTIILDGSVPVEEIYKYIDISYNLK